MWDEPRRRMRPGRKTRRRSDEPRALWRRQTSGEPSREDATREETDGADSQGEPKARRAARAEERLREAPGRVRKTLGGPRERPGGERGTIARAMRMRYRPCRRALEAMATSHEERARVLSAAPKPLVRLKALEGKTARPPRPIPYLTR